MIACVAWRKTRENGELVDVDHSSVWRPQGGDETKSYTVVSGGMGPSLAIDRDDDGGDPWLGRTNALVSHVGVI